VEVYICIDDTDNLESRGTGELAALLSDDIEKKGWGTSSFITRHQLLVHPDIPYTSHNSSMCFSATINDTFLETLISHASGFLEKESAEGSDPGLCVAVADRIGSRETLMEFGRKAKQQVVTKSEAYYLAQNLGVHLSAHGGTGHGVIGALAGVGLRLGGNDGRMRGGLNLGAERSVVTVGEICSHPQVDAVRSTDGKILHNEEIVVLGEKIKTVLLEGMSVLLVMPGEGGSDSAPWRTCPRQLLKKY
jgi:hypothetical protein